MTRRPFTKAEVAGIMDVLAKEARREDETTEQAFARLCLDDPDFKELYETYLNAPGRSQAPSP